MNYLKVYDSIINRAKFRTFSDNQYFEKHHILPRCMGGNNESENIVKLTYREHFISHWLLHRIYPNNKKIAAAFHILAFGTNCRDTRKDYDFYMPSSRALEEAKLAKIHHRKNTKHSDETKAKLKETWKNKKDSGYIQKNNKGRKLTNDHKIKIGLSKIGKSRSEEIKIKISETKKRQYQEYLEINNGVKRKISQDTKNKIRNKVLERGQKKK